MKKIYAFLAAVAAMCAVALIVPEAVVAATSAAGLAVRRGTDEVPYAESAYGSMYSGTTSHDITMAATAANKMLGNDNNGSTGDLTAGDSNQVTLAVDTGRITIQNPGDYCLDFSGQVEGEEDEDVLLEWYKNGTALNPPFETDIIFGIATTVEGALIQLVSKTTCIDDLKSGDYLQLGVLGSNDEVIKFDRFNFGIRQVKSGI